MADETVAGIVWAQMLYVSLLQSVQVMLVGSEVGGFWAILAIFERESGPVTVSTFVRVSVRQNVPPLISVPICQFPLWFGLVGHTV